MTGKYIFIVFPTFWKCCTLIICKHLLEPANTIPTAIVERAVHGDADAQALLYQQYAKAMFNICIRMAGNRRDAEDILQEAFLKAFQQLQQLREAALFGGWLKKIVINECIGYSKRSFYWDDWNDAADNIVDEDTSPWWASVSLRLLHNTIKKLPEGCRQIFVLYAMEDHSHKEIAAELGISEGTSKSQYHRAKQLLKEKISIQINIYG